MSGLLRQCTVVLEARRRNRDKDARAVVGFPQRPRETSMTITTATTIEAWSGASVRKPQKPE